jgi:hypothetical protein
VLCGRPTPLNRAHGATSNLISCLVATISMQITRSAFLVWRRLKRVFRAESSLVCRPETANEAMAAGSWRTLAAEVDSLPSDP